MTKNFKLNWKLPTCKRQRGRDSSSHWQEQPGGVSPKLHQDISIPGLKDQVHPQRNQKLPLHVTCPQKDNYDGQKRVVLDLQAFKDPDQLQFLDGTKGMPSVESEGLVRWEEISYTSVPWEASHLFFFSWMP